MRKYLTQVCVSMAVGLALFTPQVGRCENLYKYWKKNGVDLATDAGCKRVLELMVFNAKKSGPATAITDYADMAAAIRGKSEACQNVKLGTSLVTLALDGSGGNLISGYKYLREAADSYGVDVAALIPKL